MKASDRLRSVYESSAEWADRIPRDQFDRYCQYIEDMEIRVDDEEEAARQLLEFSRALKRGERL